MIFNDTSKPPGPPPHRKKMANPRADSSPKIRRSNLQSTDFALQPLILLGTEREGMTRNETARPCLTVS